ncbi:alkaline ceramidase 3-like [Branchiostoma floridae]|nr:alkaline ceramidase 3-like [Branchiostoma floridae]
MIIPPILAGIKAYQEKLETRYVVSFFSILVVGIGSWCFHMTLLYEMQLFDELPMIWGSCIFVFDLFHSFTPPKYQNLPMILCLVLYSFIITAINPPSVPVKRSPQLYLFRIMTSDFLPLRKPRNK